MARKKLFCGTPLTCWSYALVAPSTNTHTTHELSPRCLRMETPLVGEQICLVYHPANKADLQIDQAYTVREDGEVVASDLQFADRFYRKMQTTCWVCYSSSSVLCIPQTALTGAAFSCREAVLPGLTVCWYQLYSKSLSVPDISGGLAVSPFQGDVVCLSVNCFCWSFLFFSQISFEKFSSYLLINPFPHQASIILLKYNLIFFPEVHLFAFPLRFLFSAAKLFFLISILLMVSLFWLVPHSQKKILAITVSVGEREKHVANSWKLSFLSTVPKLLTASCFHSETAS